MFNDEYLCVLWTFGLQANTAESFAINCTLVRVSTHYDSTGFHNPLAGFSLLILQVSRSHTRTDHSR